MDERIPSMAETEKLKDFLNKAEAHAGIPNSQRNSRILIGFLERHFVLEVPTQRVMRRNGRGQMEFKDKGVMKFKRSQHSMPSSEHLSHGNLEVELQFIPETGQYFMALQTSTEKIKTYHSGPIAFDQILPKLDEFLEQLASE